MRAYDKRPCPSCDICGRMVSWKDAENTDKFVYRMITPESDVSSEAWEMYHTACREKAEAMLAKGKEREEGK